MGADAPILVYVLVALIGALLLWQRATVVAFADRAARSVGMGLLPDVLLKGLLLVWRTAFLLIAACWVLFGVVGVVVAILD